MRPIRSATSEIRGLAIFCNRLQASTVLRIFSKLMGLFEAYEVPLRSPGGNICLSSPVISPRDVCL